MRASLVAVAAIVGCGRLGFDGVDGAVVPDDASCAFTLCEDFDDGPPFAQWDMVLGSPNIDLAMSVSPPGSMTVTRADARADGTAFLEKASSPRRIGRVMASAFTSARARRRSSRAMTR